MALFSLGVFIAAYLLGSIPFGLVITRLAGKGDIRKIGSGNIGATNVLRTGSKTLAALTLFLDGGKGALAVIFAELIGGVGVNTFMPCVAALGAIVGHLFPVWLKFRGGKGVATALGAYFALAWPIGAGACATWLLTAILFRYSSLAALVAMIIAVPLAIHFSNPSVAYAVLLISGVVWMRHASNICRLLNRAEPKIGQHKNAAPAA